MKCTICNETELTNGLDTFGDIGSEMCQGCWIRLPEMLPTHSWYGLAPHTHNLELTGDYIGSTEFTDYRSKPKNDNGEYEIEPGLWFWPDPEVNGEMGVWTEEGVR